MKILLLMIASILVCSSARLTAALPGDDWKYADLTKLIDDRQSEGRPYKNLDEFLADLPPGLKSRFTFMFRTQNKFQDADPLHPRAIVFNNNLVFTFNGHASQMGHNSLEVMELDEAEGRIEMREIEFQPTGISYSTSTPRKCMECHGYDPKPIWPQYPGWEGAYGGDDDRLFDTELSNYRAFLTSVKQGENPRYSHLNFPRDSDVPPYKPTAGIGTEAHRINLIFTKLLTRFNTVRLSRILRESPYFASYKYFVPLVALKYQCRNIESVLTKFETHLNQVMKDRQIRLSGPARVHSKLFSVLGAPISRFSMTPNATDYFFSDGTAEQVTLVGHVGLKALLSDEPGLGEFSFVSDFHHDLYDVVNFYRRIDTVFPVLKEAGLIDCDGVIKKASDALDHIQLPDAQIPDGSFEQRLRDAEDRRANPAIPVSCVYCHASHGSNPDNAPRIAFDSERDLATELRLRGGRLLRAIEWRASSQAPTQVKMPPPSGEEFTPLSQDEWSTFVDYLKKLAGQKR